MKEGSAAERVIPTVIRLTENNENLIAGVNAKAEIIIDEVEGALAVPIEAVQDNGDGTGTVRRVKEDNTIETVAVKLGLETDLLIQIIGDDIQEGDQLVLNGEELADGTLVSVNVI